MTTQQIILSAAKEGARVLSERYAELAIVLDRTGDIFLAMGEPGKRGRKPGVVAIDKPARKRRPLSAAARKSIAAAQTKRWAEFRKKKAAAVKAAAVKAAGGAA